MIPRPITPIFWWYDWDINVWRPAGWNFFQDCGQNRQQAM
jgi:hypothetical protein